MRRRFRRRPPLWFWLLLSLAVLGLGRWWLVPRESTPILADGIARVVGVVDGNALEIESARSPGMVVRLLGVRVIDQSAAAAWLADNVVGQDVRIELDKRRRAADGASLAYLYLGRKFVNAELIRQGCARHDAYPGDSASHAKILRDAE